MTPPEHGLPLIVALARTQEPRPLRPYRYVEADDALCIEIDGAWVAAIDAPGEAPETKKADLERGEDQKERWR